MQFTLKHLSLLLPLTFAISACEDKSAKIGCSDPDAQKVLIDLLNREAYKALSSEVEAFKDITSQNKRSALDKLTLSMSEIMTTSKDSNSTMKTCEATVALTIPSENYNDLVDLFKETTGNNLERYLEDKSLQQRANSFSKRVEYTVQPTDDAKTIFVKTLDSDISSAMSEVASLIVLKPIIEQQKSEKAAQKLKQEMEEKEAAAVKEAAAKEAEKRQQAQSQELQLQAPSEQMIQPAQAAPRKAPPQSNSNALSQAKSRFQAADAELNRVWKQFDKSVRQELLPRQRQWLKNKDATCGKVTMKGSEKALIDMYNCQRQMTEARVREFHGFG